MTIEATCIYRDTNTCTCAYNSELAIYFVARTMIIVPNLILLALTGVKNTYRYIEINIKFVNKQISHYSGLVKAQCWSGAVFLLAFQETLNDGMPLNRLLAKA